MKYIRIKKNTDFQKLFNRGKRVFSPCITLLYFPADTLSMGIAVSKKHGKATVRNRIKRLAREAFRNTSGILEGSYSVIILPKIADEYCYQDFEKSLISCFKKVNACAKNWKNAISFCENTYLGRILKCCFRGWLYSISGIFPGIPAFTVRPVRNTFCAH